MMPNNILEFEKPLIELQEKIKELQQFMQEKDLDIGDEIMRLKNRAHKLEQEIYNSIKPWQILQIARHQERPNTGDYINLIFDDYIELHGDRLYGDDQALIGGIGLIEGKPVTIIGNQKGKSTRENLQRNFGMAHPEGYRKALRLMKQAEKFNRPVVSLVNTPGAYPGIEAEERGQAVAIAENLLEMSDLAVPIIVIIIGEGGSGGAIGIGLGDKVMMMEYSYYSVSTPEACAAILWKDSSKAPEAAEAMSITAPDLLKLGIVDKIIKEPRGGAHKNHGKAASMLKKEILHSINELSSLHREELLQRRYDKYRKIGSFTDKFNNAQSS